MLASAGVPKVRTWATKFEIRSPRYTTRLAELPVVGMALPPRCDEDSRPTSRTPTREDRAVPSMPMLETYDIIEDDDGTYAVVYARTGTVVVMNGIAQRGLDLQDADAMADHLEAIDRIAASHGTGTWNS